MKPTSRFGDPATPSLLLFAAIAAGGFVAIGIGWKVAARTLVVAYQVPAIVSGCIGGLALVVIGASLFAAQLNRRWAAREQAEYDALLQAASAAVVRRRK